MSPLSLSAPAPRVIEALEQYFGHRSFRSGQEDLVNAVLDGHDVLAVMPTGSGKSLGFQLPAVLLPGISLVVSPLISLMKDQVDELNRRGIRAAAVHSQTSTSARRDAFHAISRGELRLLYVAPERLASGRFVTFLRDLPIARVIVDEAHCVSEWGHDFRPDYRRIRGAAAMCRRADGRPGRPPIAAFTATATPEVRDDIVSLLDLSTPRVVVAGFDRPNIRMVVCPVAEEFDKRALLPGLVVGRRSLVYAATRRNAELAEEVLTAEGIAAAAYHAGLPAEERSRVQDGFASGSIRVVCATNAFGMGIDRPDVEAVVHVDLPGSVEAYYQEIGRAGRDGRAAVATLLWYYPDVSTREYLIERSREDKRRARVDIDPEEIEKRKELERRKLQRMIAYAECRGCLRGEILRYFGDPEAPARCVACGNCRSEAQLDPRAQLVLRKVLSGIARAGERYGRRKIAAMLAGDVADLPPQLAEVSTAGILSAEGTRRIERWLDAARDAGLVAVSEDRYHTLSLTPLGRDVMSGQAPDVVVSVPEEGVRPRRRRYP